MKDRGKQTPALSVSFNTVGPEIAGVVASFARSGAEFDSLWVHQNSCRYGILIVP